MTKTLTMLLADGHADAEKSLKGMVALYVPLDVAKTLVVDDGEEVDSLHVTLAFLGEQGTDWEPEQTQDIIRAVQNAVAETGPMDGSVQGFGRFNTPPDVPQEPIWAHLDLPGLTRLRESIVGSLQSAGLFVSDDHGFTPHITLKYLDTSDPMPDMRVNPRPVTFTEVVVKLAEERHPVSFTAKKEKNMAPMVDTDAAMKITPESTNTDDTPAVYALVWDGSPSRFTADQLQAAAAVTDNDVHKLLHHDPSGDLNVDGLAAAAARIGQVQGPSQALAKAHLRAHYAELDKTPPPSLSMSAAEEAFVLSAANDAAIAAATPDRTSLFEMVFREGEQTVDRRVVDPGAVQFDRLPPLPLFLKTAHSPGHEGGEQAGVITELSREGDLIIARGYFDLGSPAGIDAHRRVREGILNSWSPGFAPDMDANVEVTEDAMGMPVEEILHVTRGTMIEASVVTMPALSSARIAMADDIEAMSTLRPPLSVTASGHPLTNPPSSFFADPGLDELQRWITITDEGRVYGHLAGFSECHISVLDYCLRADELSLGGFDFATPGHVVTADGQELGVMPLAIKGGHAPTTIDWRKAQSHYDDPSAAPALVCVGTDEFGVWFSGALKPAATEDDIYTLRAHGVSGDWRKIGDSLRLIGACSVNVPGFPKVHARVASGEVIAITAAGGPPVPTPVLRPVTAEELTQRLESVEAFVRSQRKADILRRVS